MIVESPKALAEVMDPTLDAAQSPVGASADSIVDRFERVISSRLLGVFAPALFDEMMLPAVSAALMDTARIREDPFGRARRTAASDQLVFLAADGDRREEMRRLVQLHRDVKGVGPEGVAYHALSPEPWNWNLISIFFMHRNAFAALSGERPTALDNQAIWDRFRALSTDLQLPGHARRLPEDYDDLCAYYEWMATDKLEHTASLDVVVDATLRPRRPDSVPMVFAPLWILLGPMVGQAVAVLGFGIMHPRVRALVPMRWTRRHDIEFAALTGLLRMLYRWVPRRFTDTALARNRCQYRRLVTDYQGLGLVSFAPGAARTCGR